MRYWSYNEMTEDGFGNEVITLSEDEIIQQFFPYWDKKMIEKFGPDYQQNWSIQDCIDDWVVINWAWESNDDPA